VPGGLDGNVKNAATNLRAVVAGRDSRSLRTFALTRACSECRTSTWVPQTVLIAGGCEHLLAAAGRTRLISLRTRPNRWRATKHPASRHPDSFCSTVVVHPAETINGPRLCDVARAPNRMSAASNQPNARQLSRARDEPAARVALVAAARRMPMGVRNGAARWRAALI
jgi:hypothetical protein